MREGEVGRRIRSGWQCRGRRRMSFRLHRIRWRRRRLLWVWVLVKARHRRRRRARMRVERLLPMVLRLLLLRHLDHQPRYRRLLLLAMVTVNPLLCLTRRLGHFRHPLMLVHVPKPNSNNHMVFLLLLGTLTALDHNRQHRPKSMR